MPIVGENIRQSSPVNGLFRNISLPFCIFLCVTLLLIVGFIDYITGEEISFSLFYLLPVSFATWRAGKWTGIVFCFAGATMWLFADIMTGHVYSHAGIPYWNAFVRLSFFLIVSHLLTKLKVSLSHEKTLSRTDALTGLYNTRAFYDFAETEIQRSRRFKRPLTLGYMDLDNFKTVNDQSGHSTGDALLQSVAEIIRNNTRAVDIPARLGGDEFAILLTETGIESAHTVFLKIQEKILEIMQRNRWPVTVSIGSVTYKNPPETVDDMLRKADSLMYTVKNSGKNRTMHETADN